MWKMYNCNHSVKGDFIDCKNVNPETGKSERKGERMSISQAPMECPAPRVTRDAAIWRENLRELDGPQPRLKATRNDLEF